MDINNVITPCFVLDEEEFDRAIIGFRDALTKQFESSRLGYSVKTNSLPYALVQARKLGCSAEVVSDDEFALAQMCGFPLNDIIFNGPMKSKEQFLKAIKGGSIVNIETHREIDWLEELPHDSIYNIGIRLNVNNSKVSPTDADGKNDFSRFGFSDETDELSTAISRIRSYSHVKLTGLHVHRTSHTRSVNFYSNLCSFVCSVIKKYNLSVEYIDLGGGWFGIFRNAPTFNDYTSAIYNVLKANELTHLTVIVEPGNALSAGAFSYVTSVIDTKMLPDRRIITTDGSRNDIDPFYRKGRYMTDIIRLNEDRDIEPIQIVGGSTCLEYDQIFKLENSPTINVGDKIVYNRIGAYTLTLSPMFINYLPRVYSKRGEMLKLVREKWTADEMIRKSLID